MILSLAFGLLREIRQPMLIIILIKVKPILYSEKIALIGSLILIMLII